MNNAVNESFANKCQPLESHGYIASGSKLHVRYKHKESIVNIPREGMLKHPIGLI